MVEVVDEEDGAQLLGLEGARQLHEQVHARIPHAVQVVVQLPILHHKRFMLCRKEKKRLRLPMSSQVLYRAGQVMSRTLLCCCCVTEQFRSFCRFCQIRSFHLLGFREHQ